MIPYVTIYFGYFWEISKVFNYFNCSFIMLEFSTIAQIILARQRDIFLSSFGVVRIKLKIPLQMSWLWINILFPYLWIIISRNGKLFSLTSIINSVAGWTEFKISGNEDKFILPALQNISQSKQLFQFSINLYLAMVKQFLICQYIFTSK